MACFAGDQGQAAERDYASDITFLKFKYGLQNLFTAVKILRDKESSSRQDFHLLMDKHKKLEAEHSESYSALKSEISLGTEARRMLETAVLDLRRETSSKGIEIINLKEEIKALMDSRSELAENLQASNYSLERQLEEKTHELHDLVEKHNRHSVLLEAIEKEAFVVRQAVDEANACVKYKEEEVLALQNNLLKVLGFENTFLERIGQLEQQLTDSLGYLSEKNEMIVALEKKLEAPFDDYGVEAQLAICKETLEVKDNLISEMRQEKEVLLEDVKNLECMLEKLQKTITQQDQIIMGYQRQVLALGKDADIVRDSLAKNLLLAAEDNEKLSKEMQNQKHGFAVQAQLWEDKKMVFEEKIHELEARLTDYEALLFNKVAVIKQTNTDGLYDSCIGDFSLDSSDVKNASKVSLARDEPREGIMLETIQNHSADLPVDTLTILYNIGKDTIKNSSCSRTCLNLEGSILTFETQSDQSRISGDELEHFGNKKSVQGFSGASSFLSSSTLLPSEGEKTKSMEMHLYDHAIQGINICSEPVKQIHRAGKSVVAAFDLKKIHSFNINSILERLGRPITLVRMKKKSHLLKPTGLMLLKPPKLLRQLPTMKLDELENERKAAPAHEVDDQQQEKTHLNVLESLPSKVVSMQENEGHTSAMGPYTDMRLASCSGWSLADSFDTDEPHTDNPSKQKADFNNDVALYELITEMEQELFEECKRRFEEEEEKAKVAQERRELTWQRLEVVASKSMPSQPVMVQH